MYSKTSFAKWAIIVGVLPAVLFQLFMGIIPSLTTFILSFTDSTGVRGVPVKFIGFDNYREFFVQQNPRDLKQVIINTLIFCIVVTVVQNAIAVPVALALNSKEIKGKNFYRATIFLPVVLGVLVTSLVWLCVLSPLDGPMTKLLAMFGAQNGFFEDRVYALGYVIFTQIWMALGYSMVINLAGLQAIPLEMYEAGDIDGTSRWQRFRYLTFPMLWSTINVNLILAVIGSLQSYQVLLLTTGGNRMETQTLAARAVYFAFNIKAGSGQPAMRQGYGATWSMILFVFILIATIIYQRTVNRREQEI